MSQNICEQDYSNFFGIDFKDLLDTGAKSKKKFSDNLLELFFTQDFISKLTNNDKTEYLFNIKKPEAFFNIPAPNTEPNKEQEKLINLHIIEYIKNNINLTPDNYLKIRKFLLYIGLPIKLRNEIKQKLPTEFNEVNKENYLKYIINFVIKNQPNAVGIRYGLKYPAWNKINNYFFSIKYIIDSSLVISMRPLMSDGGHHKKGYRYTDVLLEYAKNVCKLLPINDGSLSDGKQKCIKTSSKTDCLPCVETESGCSTETQQSNDEKKLHLRNNLTTLNIEDGFDIEDDVLIINIPKFYNLEPLQFNLNISTFINKLWKSPIQKPGIKYFLELMTGSKPIDSKTFLNNLGLNKVTEQSLATRIEMLSNENEINTEIRTLRKDIGLGLTSDWGTWGIEFTNKDENGKIKVPIMGYKRNTRSSDIEKQPKLTYSNKLELTKHAEGSFVKGVSLWNPDRGIEGKISKSFGEENPNLSQKAINDLVPEIFRNIREDMGQCKINESTIYGNLNNEITGDIKGIIDIDKKLKGSKLQLLDETQLEIYDGLEDNSIHNAYSEMIRKKRTAFYLTLAGLSALFLASAIMSFIPGYKVVEGTLLSAKTTTTSTGLKFSEWGMEVGSAAGIVALLTSDSGLQLFRGHNSITDPEGKNNFMKLKLTDIASTLLNADLTLEIYLLFIHYIKDTKPFLFEDNRFVIIYLRCIDSIERTINNIRKSLYFKSNMIDYDFSNRKFTTTFVEILSKYQQNMSETQKLSIKQIYGILTHINNIKTDISGGLLECTRYFNELHILYNFMCKTVSEGSAIEINEFNKILSSKNLNFNIENNNHLNFTKIKDKLRFRPITNILGKIIVNFKQTKIDIDIFLRDLNLGSDIIMEGFKAELVKELMLFEYPNNNILNKILIKNIDNDREFFQNIFNKSLDTNLTNCLKPLFNLIDMENFEPLNDAPKKYMKELLDLLPNIDIFNNKMYFFDKNFNFISNTHSNFSDAFTDVFITRL